MLSILDLACDLIIIVILAWVWCVASNCTCAVAASPSVSYSVSVPVPSLTRRLAGMLGEPGRQQLRTVVFMEWI
jgi:hypothetical protein